ncbi:hypothetical protein [Terricaulis sp.]|uniref:hypothetical protein n=1 Tax=Terricaulis sp. TaxID=2768686 RepID=UPI00378482E7
MKLMAGLALAALGTGLMTEAAQARDFDSTMSARSDEEGVQMRFALPFGHRVHEDAARLSLGFTQSRFGETRNLEVVSLSLVDGGTRLQSPLALGFDSEGGWFSQPTHWLWMAAGVGIAYAIYENNQDDDNQTTVCSQQKTGPQQAC